MENQKAHFRVGTSDIVVPGRKENYPPAWLGKSRLNYYSSFFNSLEVNSSFYKIPMPQTFARWSMDVPGNFQFTLKLFKEITHARDLKFEPGYIKQFLDAANGLGDKKGCLLIQFPGKITMDYYNSIEQILELVKQNDVDNTWRIAVEFRNAGWYSAETFELMDEFGASVVMHDIPKGRNQVVPQKASFVYKRFHGPAGDYRGSYTEAQLMQHANEIKKLIEEGKDVYAYFNNTAGDAYNNAVDLGTLVSV